MLSIILVAASAYIQGLVDTPLLKTMLTGLCIMIVLGVIYKTKKPRFIYDFIICPIPLVLSPIMPIIVPHIVMEQYRIRREANVKFPIYFGMSNLIPPPSTILRRSASEMGYLLRRGEVTSTELVEATIRQIERVDSTSTPILLAIVGRRYDAARQQARKADIQLSAAKVSRNLSELSPFFGVPFVCKECFEVKGMPYSAGVPDRIQHNVVGQRTCDAVQAAIDAGMILLATTTVSEACMWIEATQVSVVGKNKYQRRNTRNPYNLGRTSGGSSGGNGALLGCCAAPIAIGSDVGGSIRIPSLYCGTFGHKPTGGTITNQGTYPSVGLKEINRYCQLGPMTKSSHDLMPLLRILASAPNPKNPSSATWISDWQNPSDINVSEYNILVIESLPYSGITTSMMHPDMLKASRLAQRKLREIGCTVTVVDVDKELPELKESFDIWSLLMKLAEKDPFGMTIGTSSPDKPNIPIGFIDLMKAAVGHSDHTIAATALGCLEHIFHPSLSSSRCKRLLAVADKLRCKFDRLFSHGTSNTKTDVVDNFVLLYPSLPVPAPRHHEALLRFLDIQATAIFNVMELPVTQVPMGLSSISKLPVGIQIVGAHGRDDMTIAVALALEDNGVAGWVPPSEMCDD